MGRHENRDGGSIHCTWERLLLLKREAKHEIVPLLFNLTISSATLIVIIYGIIVTMLFTRNSIGTILYETKKRCETLNSTSTIQSDYS